MQQIQLYSAKDEPKIFYWLTKEEAEGIKKLLQDGAKFITISRLDKTINVRDVKEVGTPDFVKSALEDGKKILWWRKNPIILLEDGDYLQREDDDKWHKYWGRIQPESCQTYEEFIGATKQLNGR